MVLHLYVGIDIDKGACISVNDIIEPLDVSVFICNGEHIMSVFPVGGIPSLLMNMPSVL